VFASASEQLSGDVLGDIAEQAASYANDPLGYTMWNFPWGEGALSKWEGPDRWQIEFLDKLGRALRGEEVEGFQRENGTPIRMAVAGCNGGGKSALVSMVIKWAMDCYVDARCNVTANTSTQLRTKTWAELAKWHNLSLTEPLLKLNGMSIESRLPRHRQVWRADAVPWSKERPEAVAGLHNEGKIVLLVFDESSAIDDVIWEYADASTTDDDTVIIWLVFGNATRNSGRFRECFRKFKHRWITMRVDGRHCRTTNKKLIKQWEDDYGPDSDFYRVRVRAEFPRVGDLQFFPSDWITGAKARLIPDEQVLQVPAVISVDVATTGSNKSVITLRRGTKIIWIKKENYTPDTMVLVDKIVLIAKDEWNVKYIAVDANGVGKGVADRLSQLHERRICPPIVHVYGAHAASDPIQFRNLRSELFSRFKDWLKHGSLPERESELAEQMEAIEAGYNTNTMELEVETKKAMTLRLGSSPDELDSVVYGFAEYVPQMSSNSIQSTARSAARPVTVVKWR